MGQTKVMVRQNIISYFSRKIVFVVFMKLFIFIPICRMYILDHDLEQDIKKPIVNYNTTINFKRISIPICNYYKII